MALDILTCAQFAWRQTQDWAHLYSIIIEPETG